MLTASLSRHSVKFTYSSRRNPCPVCGRTKDSDCRLDDKGRWHCRTYAKDPPKVGDVIRGHDGRQWAYLGESDQGRWALFKLHEERRKDDRDPNLATFAKRSTSSPNPTPKSAATPERPTSAPLPAKKPSPKGQREFIYHDADGQPVIKVLRTDYGDGTKKFSQFRYENGDWISGLNDQVTKRVRLYRIAEARALSEKTGHPIFLVEGEKCVERLMELGIPATTSIGGAKKWTGYGFPNYLQDLQGCRIILSPDADRPGLGHMLEIERSLRQHGIEVAGWLLAPPNAPWENLPDGGGLDVVDWLESGATAEDILRSIRVALPAHLAAEDEIADLAAEVSELAQLDQASGLTLLPKVLDIPLRRIAEGLNLPVEAYYLVLLCVAAGLIPSQTRLMIDPGTDFEVPPILWGGLVGETGSGKTHIINTLTKPLKALQTEYHIRYQHQLEDYKAAQREYERKKKSDDAGDPPTRPRLTTLYVSNYTMEAISQILSQQPDRGLLISPDELTAFLRSMNAYRGGKGADRSHWLSLYGSDPLRVDRKTSDPIYVPYPSVSVVGGIQPSILQKVWQEDKDFGDGLWARFTWVKVPLVPRSRTRRGATHNPRQLLESVYRRLQAFPPMRHELDKEGWRLWEKWECEFDEPILTEPDERIRGTLPKAIERAARIALVLHWLDAACDGVTPGKVIPANTLARAIEFTRWLQNQTRLIYGELGESSSPEASFVLRFVGRFKGCGPISMKQCRSWWPTRRKPPVREIRAFLDNLVQMGHARWVGQHIEVVVATRRLREHSSSSTNLRHFVTQEPESLAQSRFEPVTKASSLVVTSSSPVVAPMVRVSVAEQQKSAQLESAEPSLSQPANQNPQSLANQGPEPVGTSSQPMPTQPTVVTPADSDKSAQLESATRNHASSGWQSWQELDGNVNHVKASNGKHSGAPVGKLAHFDMEQGSVNGKVASCPAQAGPHVSPEPLSDYDMAPDPWPTHSKANHVRKDYVRIARTVDRVSSRCPQTRRLANNNDHGAEMETSHSAAHEGIPPWQWEGY